MHYNSNLAAMKTFTNANLLALAAATTALRPSPASRRQLSERQNTCGIEYPMVDDALAAIAAWNDDVQNVYQLLDLVNGEFREPIIAARTQAVLLFAQDKPCQLKTLINFQQVRGGGTSAFDCATDDLSANFGDNVVNNLETVMYQAQTGTVDLGYVNDLIEEVNVFRCCAVLPDVDLIWLDSADSASAIGNASVPITAPRPARCSTVDCTDPRVVNHGQVLNCRSKNNGNDG